MTANEEHASNVAKQEDHRTAREVLRQYERLRTIKKQLVATGEVNGDATTEKVIARLREIVPADAL